MKSFLLRKRKKATYTGYSAGEANGYGYLYAGGMKVKAHIIQGTIQGCCGGNPAHDYVEINGNRYAVDGNNLID